MYDNTTTHTIMDHQECYIHDTTCGVSDDCLTVYFMILWRFGFRPVCAVVYRVHGGCVLRFNGGGG
jgi:hypothetical protein